MNKSKYRIIAMLMAFALLSGCAVAAQGSSTDVKVSQQITQIVGVFSVDAQEPGYLPNETTIPIKTGNKTVSLAAYKHVSRLGYVIYLPPQFSLQTSFEGDVVTLVNAPNDNLGSIKMTVTAIEKPLPTNARTQSDDKLRLVTKSQTCSVGDSNFLVVMEYPASLEDGAAALMEAIMKSITYESDEVLSGSYSPPIPQPGSIDTQSWPEHLPVVTENVLFIDSVDLASDTVNVTLGFFERPVGYDLYDYGYQFAMTRTYRRASYGISQDAEFFFRQMANAPEKLGGLADVSQKVADGFSAWKATYEDGEITSLTNIPWQETFAYKIVEFAVSKDGKSVIRAIPGKFISYPSLENNYKFDSYGAESMVELEIADGAVITTGYIYGSDEGTTITSLDEFYDAFCKIVLKDNKAAEIHGIFTP